MLISCLITGVICFTAGFGAGWIAYIAKQTKDLMDLWWGW